MDISEDELFRFRLDSGRYDPSGPIELAGTSDDDEKEEVNVRNPRSPSLDEVRDFMGKHEYVDIYTLLTVTNCSIEKQHTHTAITIVWSLSIEK